MRKLASLILLLWLASLSAAAQDFPKAEIFGGYQLTRLDGTTLNGWNAALTGNLNHWFGVTARLQRRLQIGGRRGLPQLHLHLRPDYRGPGQ